MGLIQILNNTRQMDIISILGMPVALNGVLLNAAVVIQKGECWALSRRLIFPIIRSFMRSAGLLPHVMWQKTVCAFAGRLFRWGETCCSKRRIPLSEWRYARTCRHPYRPAPRWRCKVRKSCSIFLPTMKVSASTIICARSSASSRHDALPVMYSAHAVSENPLRMWCLPATD